VATSAILEVLKNSGRLRRSSGGYVKTPEVPISPVVNSAPDTYYTDELGNILYDIPDPTPHIEESIIREEDLRTLVDSIHTISKDEADKDFITLFHLRYVKGLKQKEIAQELGISQGEVSKRILKMIQKLNASLDPNKD